MSFGANPVLIDKLRRSEMRRNFSVYGAITAITIYVMEQGGITQKQAACIAWDEVANEPKCLPPHLRTKWHIDRILNGEVGQAIESRSVSATELIKRLNAVCI